MSRRLPAVLRSLSCCAVLMLVTAHAWSQTSPPDLGVDDVDGVDGVDECECLDMVFVIDGTASIRQALGGIKDDLQLAIDEALFQTGGDLRLGLVKFGSQVNAIRSLTTNIQAVRSSIDSFFAGGGGNNAEASDEGLRETVTRNGECVGDDFTTPFRGGCRKIVALFTDDRPAGCDDRYTQGEDDVNAHQRALDAAAQGIQIAALFVPAGPPPAEAIMMDYAEVTGGVYARIGFDGSGTLDALRELIGNGGPDCNENGFLDSCDIQSGESNDGNENGIPDECENCDADVNGDGLVGFGDVLVIIGTWGPCPPKGECPGDVDGDGSVGFSDLMQVLSTWGLICEP